MIYFQAGLLRHLTPFRKIIVLVLLALLSMLIFMVTGWLAAAMIFNNFSELFTQMNDYNNIEVIRLLKYFQIINQVGLFVVPPVIFAYIDGQSIRNYLKLDSRPGFWIIVMSITMVIAILPLIHVSALLNELLRLPGWLHGLENWMRQSETNAENLTKAFLDVKTTEGFIVNLIMIALLPAVGEELFFRGVLQKLFHRWLGNIHWAVVLTAILFSAMHFQFYGFLPRTILGIMFGYLFVATQSLWIPILVHLFNNGAAVLVAFLYQHKVIAIDYHDIGQSTEPFLVIAGTCMVLILFVGIYQLSYRRRNRDTEY